MIKITQPKNQKTPKILKNKCGYGNKGTASLKTKAGTFSAKASSNPGMGKGKARGMGAAISGGKFSGIY